ncbi:hypothetical protein CHLNCDRAFT_59382 [Chlorella variabilis]|uniref:Aquaporin n=1 Tax=Chlorella variabilis TaxID=554065 RepID=E1ZTE1_CHLVA|nr:hypothetical protein CHLNCDRAFT_59382 [Chlorella variabilis]EFN50884.1 hypothetical protein CHLNCDRAFT_59382 [Chlorella variabilis]|eukprot:XP_005842986.1 hypothetical protein CHLNCDRAFT_59382 [Chlorella variabilis]
MESPALQQQGADAPSITSSRKAFCDFAVTALFIGVTASFVELSKHVSPSLGLSPGGAGLALTLLLLVVLVPVCEQLGGALFNPANNAFLYATGQGSGQEHILRSVAQAVGGVVGALLATALLPVSWTRELSVMAVGLRPGVTLLEGVACEFILGSLLAFVVLLAGQLKSSALKLWIPLIATVVAVKAGASYTGPSLNPAFTFSWVFVYELQSPAEHLLVFWLAPIASGLFGGFAFRGYQLFQQDRTRRQQQQQGRRRAGRSKEE